MVVKVLNLFEFFLQHSINCSSFALPFVLFQLVFGLMLKVEMIREVLDEEGDLFFDVGKGFEFDLMKEVKCVGLVGHLI